VSVSGNKKKAGRMVIGLALAGIAPVNGNVCLLNNGWSYAKKTFSIFYCKSALYFKKGYRFEYRLLQKSVG
jgi:hypothetical protein